MSYCSLGLSCEPIKSESSGYCEHGRYQLTCEWCAIVDLRNQLVVLRNRVQALHEHKLRQIDENRKISLRVDELEEMVRRILKGEMQNENRPFMCPVCHGSIKILIDPATPMSGIQAMFGKRDENGMYYKDCNSCDGKGIVWG